MANVKARAGGKRPRRQFLSGAAVAAAGTLAAPSVVKAQGPIHMRWQSTWPAKDIFHEYAQDFAKKVNDMTGGGLKIEVLPSGAVVPAFGLLDAVTKGTLDGGHGVLVYHYGKQPALALWGSGPAFGMDANMLLAWHKYGGGKELLQKLYASIGAEVVSFPYGPMPTAAPGLVQEADRQGRRPRGTEIPHRRHLDRRVHRHGRRGQRAPWWRDRPGPGPGTARRRRIQQRVVGPYAGLSGRVEGLHAAELSPELRAVRDPVQQGQVRSLARQHQVDHRQRGRGRIAGHAWKAIDRYSQDYLDMQTEDGVKFYKTPDAILQRQLEVYDEVAKKKSADNPMFKEILELADRLRQAGDALGAGHRDQPPDGVDHYFGPNAAATKL